MRAGLGRVRIVERDEEQGVLDREGLRRRLGRAVRRWARETAELVEGEVRLRQQMRGGMAGLWATNTNGSAWLDEAWGGVERLPAGRAVTAAVVVVVVSRAGP